VGKILSPLYIHALEDIGREKGCKTASIHSEQIGLLHFKELDYRIVSDEFYPKITFLGGFLEKNL